MVGQQQTKKPAVTVHEEFHHMSLQKGRNIQEIKTTGTHVHDGNHRKPGEPDRSKHGKPTVNPSKWDDQKKTLGCHTTHFHKEGS